MAIIGFPYNSLNKDRAIKAEVYRRLLSKYFTTGVFPNPSTQCQVVASSGMNVVVKKGSANINGLYVEIEEDTSVQLNSPDSLDRYDRIVLRSDDSQSVRATKVVVIKGTPSGNPKAPSLTRNETVYDICLATILVPSTASSIVDSYITDTRLDSGLCGIVSATIESIDTTRFYTQIQDDLDRFRKNEQADFSDWRKEQEKDFVDWFNSLKDYISEDVLGEILVTVQQNKEDIEKLQYTGNIVSGETFSGKASNKGIKLHKVVGKTEQDGEPNPDNEVPIQNVEITTIDSAKKNLCTGVSEGYFISSEATSFGVASSDSGVIIPTNGVESMTVSTNVTQTRYRVGVSNKKLSLDETDTIYLGKNLDRTSQSVTLETADYKYLVVNATNLNEIQVEIGSQVTEFDPYKGATVETSLKLAEGDVFENDVVTKKRKKVYLKDCLGNVAVSGDQQWYDSEKSYSYEMKSLNIKKTGYIGLCSHFKTYNFENFYGKSIETGIMTVSSQYIVVNISKSFGICSTVDEFKRWVNENNVYIEIEQESPTAETIKVPTIPSYYPNTNVWTDNTLSTDIEWEVLANADNSLNVEKNTKDISNIQKNMLEKVYRGTIDSTEWKTFELDQIAKPYILVMSRVANGNPTGEHYMIIATTGESEENVGNASVVSHTGGDYSEYFELGWNSNNSFAVHALTGSWFYVTLFG